MSNFLRRLNKENELVKNITYRFPLLSENKKTGHAINLPIKNCRPSAYCQKVCYACLGPISFDASINRSLLTDYLLSSGDVNGFIYECSALTSCRICGSGDLNIEQAPSIIKIAKACPKTSFYGFTRKREIADGLLKKVKNLFMMLSIDHTTPENVYKGYKGKIAFGPRVKGVDMPKIKNISVSFPEHHRGETVEGIKELDSDCPATRGLSHEGACLNCRKCMGGK